MPAINLAEWRDDPDLTLFACNQVRKVAGTTKGVLHARVLAVSKGYVIALEPEKPLAPASSAAASAGAADAADSARASSAVKFEGKAFIRSKHRLSDLHRIACSKQNPALLSFYWRADDAAKMRLEARAKAQHDENGSRDSADSKLPDVSVQMFLVDQHAQCVALIRGNFNALKSAQVTAESDAQPAADSSAPSAPASD